MHDLIVVGGGAAGVAAALAARERGLDVVLVEGRERRGRAFLEAALATELADHPTRGDARDFRRAVRRAGELSAGAQDHVQAQLARRGVARLPGRAQIDGEPGVVLVEPHAGPAETLRARYVLLATGSRRVVPQHAPAEELADERAGLTDLALPPASAIVVGGGRAGVEIVGLLACAGASVTLVERAARLIPHADADVSAACRRALESASVIVRCGATVVDARGGSVTLASNTPRMESAGPAAEREVLQAERVYFAGSREPNLAPLSGAPQMIAALDLPLPPQHYAASVPWLFLAGGASGRGMGPEAARREGRAAVAALTGHVEHVPHLAIPHFVAGLGGGGWVGRTEAECVAAGHSIVVGRAGLPGHGALPPGFVKLIADAGSQRLLGVHVAGSRGHEAVMLASALLECGAGRQDLAAMAFPVNSPAEALAQAAVGATAP